MHTSGKHSNADRALSDLLRLQPDAEGRLIGRSATTSWQRLYGGQLLGQAIVAAAHRVEPIKRVHSLHASFLRPGSPVEDVLYATELLKDGRSLSVIRVDASQSGRLITTATVSFHIDEEAAFEHSVGMPDMAGPEEIDAPDLLTFAPLPIQRYWQQQPSLEIVPVEVSRYRTGQGQGDTQAYWVRTTGDADPTKDNNGTAQAALLAYLSDMTLLDTALAPHGPTLFSDAISGASLDHAMWFHRPVDASAWHLYVQNAPIAARARGFTQGRFFSQDGQLVCSVAQEGIIRRA